MSKMTKQFIAGALSLASATAPLAVTTMNATSTLAASKKNSKSKSPKKTSSKKSKSKSNSKKKNKAKAPSKKSSKQKKGKKSGKKKSSKNSSKKSTLSSKPSYTIGKSVTKKDHKDYNFNLPKGEKFTGTDYAVFDVNLKTSEINYTIARGKHGSSANFGPQADKHQYNQATKYVNRWYNEAQAKAKNPKLTSDTLARARKNNGTLSITKNAKGIRIDIYWVTSENPQGYHFYLLPNGKGLLDA